MLLLVVVMATNMATSSKEMQLRAALDQGILTTAEYESKLSLLRGPGNSGNLSLPTKSWNLSGGKATRADFHKNGWDVLAGPFGSESESKLAIKNTSHGGNPGLWKWATTTGSRGNYRFQCNFHQDCGVHLLQHYSANGEWWLKVSAGVDHSLESKQKKRSNSRLTLTEEAAVLIAVEHGQKPGWMHDQALLRASAPGLELHSAGVSEPAGVPVETKVRPKPVPPLCITVRF